MLNTITLIKPDDFHVHLRDGDKLATTVVDTAKRFRRALIMPNCVPPITTVAMALAYRERIMAQIPTAVTFTPYLTLYLTDTLPLTEIAKAKASGFILGGKLYPAFATTNSGAGIRDIKKSYPLFAEMEKNDLPLLIHGEVVDEDIDIFDREQVFIDRELVPLISTFPKLRIILEHITTQAAVNFVENGPETLAATVTVHHLWLNRNHLLAGGIRPHYYCAPIVKSSRDQAALQQIVLSGHPRFFLGTDSAPHAKNKKEHACGCAGVYTANAALEWCAQFFAEHQALSRLESFVSRFGAEFYHLPINEETITLVAQAQKIPDEIPFGDETVVPFFAGKTVNFSLSDSSLT